LIKWSGASSSHLLREIPVLQKSVSPEDAEIIYKSLAPNMPLVATSPSGVSLKNKDRKLERGKLDHQKQAIKGDRTPDPDAYVFLGRHGRVLRERTMITRTALPHSGGKRRDRSILYAAGTDKRRGHSH
jgi:hypothetical protein